MKFLSATAALVALSYAHAALTPSQVVQLVMQKTDLYDEGSAACDAREAFHKSVSYPTDTSAMDKFIKTYKYTSDNILGIVAKLDIEQAVGSFSDLKWAGASWKPWRRFDTVDIPEMSPYTFYVEVIEPDISKEDSPDFTSVCVTVTALRSNN